MKSPILFLTLVFFLACTSDKSADEVFNEGMKHYEKQEYLHAQQKFNETLALDADYAMAYLNRAQIHLIKDDYEDAYHDLNRFLEFDTLQSEGYTQRALLKFTLTDYYGSLSDCKRALEADEKNALAYQVKGRVKIKFGNYNGAKDDFNKAILIDDKDKKSFLLRGDVNTSLGHPDEACADYNQAAELGSMRAYKRIVDYCSQSEPEVKVITVEKPVEKVIIKERIVEKEVKKSPVPETHPEPITETQALDEWNALADLKSNVYQVKSLTINRQVKKGEPIEWGNMGPMDRTYVLVKLKEKQTFHLQFIVEGTKTYEGFYRYKGTTGENQTLYKRVDKEWDEELIVNNPLEFVLERHRTTDRTNMELRNFSRGVAAKIFF